MKSLPFLFLFLTLFSSLSAFSQDYESEELAPVPEEELVPQDEIASIIDNAEVGEMERQEDMIHPEGENEWSLGGEDLPAEEYE
jgi:hypothetical protein